MQFHSDSAIESLFPASGIFINFVFGNTYQIQDDMTKADIVGGVAGTTGTDKAAVRSMAEQFMTVHYLSSPVLESDTVYIELKTR